MSIGKKAAPALLGILALSLAGCVGEAGDQEEGDGDAATNVDDVLASLDGEPLILGQTPSEDANERLQHTDELAEMLSEELDGYPVEAFVADDYTGLILAMGTGQAHIGVFGPIAMVQSIDESGAVPILQALRDDSAEYVSQWLTNDPETYCLDDPIEYMYEDGGEEYPMLYCNDTATEEDGPRKDGPRGEEALELIEPGSTVSFVDRGSASGYFYPSTQLGQILDIDPITDIDGQFAGSHPQSALNVFSGDMTFGTSYDDVREDLVAEEPTIGEEVAVFAYTTGIPNDGVTVSGELEDDEIQAISDAFMTVADTEDGAVLLEEMSSIEGFVEADEEALEQARLVAENFGDENG